MSNHISILNKIKEHFPNEEIKYRIQKRTGNLQLLFTNKRVSLTIFADNTWDETKRCIDLKVNSERTTECSICYEIEINKRKITCTKCVCVLCVGCYVKMFRANKGIIKCPYCRFTYGHVFPDDMIENGVQQILKFKL